MNNNYQAKNGFKTFIITLSVSIFVFSTIYYVVAESLSSKTVSIEATQEKQTLTGDSVFEDISKNSAPQNNASGLVAGTTDEKESYPQDIHSSQVLAGATVTETSQATVPDTGSNWMLVAFVTAVSAISLGLYVLLQGPRKLALASFEKKVLKDL